MSSCVYQVWHHARCLLKRTYTSNILVVARCCKDNLYLEHWPNKHLATITVIWTRFTLTRSPQRQASSHWHLNIHSVGRLVEDLSDYGLSTLQSLQIASRNDRRWWVWLLISTTYENKQTTPGSVPEGQTLINANKRRYIIWVGLIVTWGLTWPRTGKVLMEGDR